MLTGQRLVDVVARRPDLRFVIPPDLQTRLTGRRVASVDRRAKFLLIRMEGDLVLLCHLGMSGSFRISSGQPPPPRPHDHIELQTGSGVTVTYHDPRRFGFVDLLTADALAAYPMLVRLGPEPLERHFTEFLFGGSARRTQHTHKIGDPRPARGRGHGKHLRVREPVSRRPVAEESGGDSCRKTRGQAGICDPRRARRGHRGGRLVVARSSPAVGRTRLFPASFFRLRERRDAVPGLHVRRGERRRRPPHRPGRAIHILLCETTALMV